MEAVGIEPTSVPCKGTSFPLAYAPDTTLILPHYDSNVDSQVQSLLSCHWTIGHQLAKIPRMGIEPILPE